MRFLFKIERGALHLYKGSLYARRRWWLLGVCIYDKWHYIERPDSNKTYPSLFPDDISRRR